MPFSENSGEWLRDYLPPETPLDQITYVALDLETTGTTFHRDGILEIALIRYRPGQKQEIFATLLNPGVPIPEASTRVHGITPEMVQHAPRFQEIAPRVAEMTRGTVLVGHSITNLDLSFLNRELRRAGLPPRLNYTLDTFFLGRYLFRSHKRRGLTELARMMGVSVEEGHRALPDARMTMKVWIKALEWFLKQGFRTLQDLMDRNLIDAGYTRRGREMLAVIRRYRFLHIVYESYVSGRTERVVEPLALRGDRLDAYCHLREDFRSFHLQRIRRIRPLEARDQEIPVP